MGWFKRFFCGIFEPHEFVASYTDEEWEDDADLCYRTGYYYCRNCGKVR
jgi:hypothetical protein